MAKRKKKGGAMGVMGGALVGAALGAAAGLFMAPASGEKLRKDVKRRAAELYKMAAPKLKQFAEMSEPEYKAVMQKALEAYGKAQKLSAEEAKMLRKEAEASWKTLQKHL